MNFKEVEKVKFELVSTFTWGVKKDKYSGYSIPVTIDSETSKKIKELVQEYDTKNPLYGDTLYLKSKNLSEKQRNDLYNKGKTSIEVHFTVKGIYTKNDTSYLTFKVTKLRKIEESKSVESCPED